MSKKFRYLTDKPTPDFRVGEHMAIILSEHIHPDLTAGIRFKIHYYPNPGGKKDILQGTLDEFFAKGGDFGKLVVSGDHTDFPNTGATSSYYNRDSELTGLSVG